MTEIEAKLSLKMTLLGSPGVGKTSLRRNFMGQNFLLSYQTTLGVDFSNKMIKIEDGNAVTNCNLQIWDLAGQMTYISVTRSFLSHCNAALLIFDVTQPDTYNHIGAWLKILYDSNKDKADNIPFIILANKADLLDKDEEQVNFDPKDYVRTLSEYQDVTPENTKFLSTSAKTGQNVDLAFRELSKVVKAKFDD